MPKPNLWTTPLVDPRTGLVRPEWRAFFQALDAASGGAGDLTTDDMSALQLVMTGTSATSLRTIGSRGLARQVLHGNPTGAPAWGAVRLTDATDVTGVLPAANGGTGFTSYTTGDLVYANASSSLGLLPAVATGMVLRSGGVGTAPEWGKVVLTDHVEGILPVANGGTGVADLFDLTDDPGAEVTFAVQAGLASTFMRSDAAPRLASTLEVPEGEDFAMTTPDDLGSTSVRGSFNFVAGENDSFSGCSVLFGGATGSVGGTVALEAGGEAFMSSGGGTNQFSLGGGANSNVLLAAAGNVLVSAAAGVTLAAGNDSMAEFPGEVAVSGIDFGGTADAKVSVFNAAIETTDATPTELETTTGAFVVLANDSSYLFQLGVVARNTATDTETASFTVIGTIRRGANAAATAVVGTPTVTVVAQDTGTTTWTCAFTADTTNGRPAVTVTGEAAKTIRWCASANMTKVSG